MDVSNYLWSIHEGHEQFSNDSRGRQEIFMCLAVLLCEQFCRFANGGAKLSIKSFMRSFFFCFSAFSSSEVLGKITSIWSKLPTKACWSREEKRGNCEANLLQFALCRKRLRYHRNTDKSFTVFFACGGVKFDDRLKILAC